MPNDDTPAPNISPEANVRQILEWLAMAHGHKGGEDAGEVLKQLLLLREAPISSPQRVKLLDLLYAHTERIVQSELPRLNELALPVPRRTRQRVRGVLDLLETLTQDYFNNLAVVFDPDGNPVGNVPQASLRRAMLSIAWQIRIHHLVASPPRPGIWQQLHAAFASARQLGIETRPAPRGGASIERLYLDILLTAIAQPASFSAIELDLITRLVESSSQLPGLTHMPPDDPDSAFWIDSERDFPAHALVRRSPAADTQPLYFSGRELSERMVALRQSLQDGAAPATLGLPEFAGSRAAQGVLRRLETLWGKPAKRRFPRRRQSYRARLCSGLDTLWQLHQTASMPAELSEWMVTNESPDGFALMHMSGTTSRLRVGDIVALQPLGESPDKSRGWHVCLIRWAISENPEHIEIGLQLIAPQAIPARIARPYELDSRHANALVLPEMPPLRPNQALVVPPGLLSERSRRIILLIEQNNLEIREVQATHLDEQTSSIEIFSVQPDQTP